MSNDFLSQILSSALGGNSGSAGGLGGLGGLGGGLGDVLGGMLGGFLMIRYWRGQTPFGRRR